MSGDSIGAYPRSHATAARGSVAGTHRRRLGLVHVLTARCGATSFNLMARGAKGRLRKTLPKDLPELMTSAAETGDYRSVHEALEHCAVDARGGFGKATPLMMRECTPELASWLLERGVDSEARDTWGKTALHASAAAPFNYRLRPEALIALGADVHATDNMGHTPLHSAADSKHLAAVRVLLSAGAKVDARSQSGHTPLESALAQMSNADFPAMVPVAQALLDAGASVSQQCRNHVRVAAERFEFHRAGFAPEHVEETSNACAALCQLFEVPLPAPRLRHDGTSPIVAHADTWQDQHEELWNLLVPSSGSCKTVQGEVVRIAGRVSDELYRNGGCNWDADYRRMLRALRRHVASHNSLPDQDLGVLDEALRQLPDDDDATRDLTRLAVAWVALNPTPIPLPPPAYER